MIYDPIYRATLWCTLSVQKLILGQHLHPSCSYFSTMWNFTLWPSKLLFEIRVKARSQSTCLIHLVFFLLLYSQDVQRVPRSILSFIHLFSMDTKRVTNTPYTVQTSSFRQSYIKYISFWTKNVCFVFKRPLQSAQMSQEQSIYR